MVANRTKGAPNHTDEHVGARIRMRRMMLSMSQTNLGDAVGITFQQVQKYEKGVNRVSASRLQQFAKVLDVTVPFFFEGLPSPNVAREVSPLSFFNDFLTSRDGLHIIKAFHQIADQKVRRSVVALVEDLAERSRRRSR